MALIEDAKNWAAEFFATGTGKKQALYTIGWCGIRQQWWGVPQLLVGIISNCLVFAFATRSATDHGGRDHSLPPWLACRSRGPHVLHGDAVGLQPVGDHHVGQPHGVGVGPVADEAGEPFTVLRVAHVRGHLGAGTLRLGHPFRSGTCRRLSGLLDHTLERARLEGSTPGLVGGDPLGLGGTLTSGERLPLAGTTGSGGGDVVVDTGGAGHGRCS